MRKALYDKLTASEAFTSRVPAERVYSGGSVGLGPELAPKSADGPFAFLQIGQTDNQFATLVFASMVLSVHAEPGSYLPIEEALYWARKAFLPTPYPSDHGWISAVEWEDSSDELYDEELRTIYKTCTWRVVASGEGSV